MACTAVCYCPEQCKEPNANNSRGGAGRIEDRDLQVCCGGLVDLWEEVRELKIAQSGPGGMGKYSPRSAVIDWVFPALELCCEHMQAFMKSGQPLPRSC